MQIQNVSQVRTDLAKLITGLGEIKDSNQEAEDSYAQAKHQSAGVKPEFETIRGNNMSPLNHLAYDFPGRDQSLEARRVDAVLNIIDAKMAESAGSFAIANGQAGAGKEKLDEVIKHACELRPLFKSNPTFLKDFDEALHELGSASYLQNDAEKTKLEASGTLNEYQAAFQAIQAPLGDLKADTAEHDSTAAGQLTYSQAYTMDKRSERFHFQMYNPSGSLSSERPYLEHAQSLLSGILGKI